MIRKAAAIATVVMALAGSFAQDTLHWAYDSRAI